MRISSLVLSAVVLPTLVQARYETFSYDDYYDDGTPCNENDAHEVTLNLRLDDQPQDTGYKLVCDDSQVIWEAAVGSFPSDQANEWIEETACISSESYCSFVLQDASGDGLTGDGFFTLTVGATTIAMSEYGADQPFTEETYCFGTGCDQVPVEQQDDEYDYYDDLYYYDQLDYDDGETYEPSDDGNTIPSDDTEFSDYNDNEEYSTEEYDDADVQDTEEPQDTVDETVEPEPEQSAETNEEESDKSPQDSQQQNKSDKPKKAILGSTLGLFGGALLLTAMACFCLVRNKPRNRAYIDISDDNEKDDDGVVKPDSDTTTSDKHPGLEKEMPDSCTEDEDDAELGTNDTN